VLVSRGLWVGELKTFTFLVLVGREGSPDPHVGVQSPTTHERHVDHQRRTIQVYIYVKPKPLVHRKKPNPIRDVFFA
jgi:hypothetical protein